MAKALDESRDGFGVFKNRTGWATISLKLAPDHSLLMTAERAEFVAFCAELAICQE
jgi:hypothetical protein